MVEVFVCFVLLPFFFSNYAPVYARPRYRNLRHKHPQKSCFVLIGMSIWQERSPSTGESARARRKRQKAIQNEEECGAFSRQIKSHSICQQVSSSNNYSNALPNEKDEAKIEEGTIDLDSALQMNTKGSDHINNGLEVEDEDSTSVAPFDENFDCSEKETDDSHETMDDSEMVVSLSVPPNEASPALKTFSEIDGHDVDA